MKNNRLIAGLVVLAALTLVAVFVVGMVTTAQQGNRPAVGSVAPDFAVGLYSNYQAGLPASLKLSDLRGKVVLVNFWASWCVECRKESDALESIWRRYRGNGLVVLGIDYLDTEAPAMEYLKSYGTTYPIGIDLQEQISRPYRITGVPETFFIDRKGVVRKIVIQALTQAELAGTVDALVNE